MLFFVVLCISGCEDKEICVSPTTDLFVSIDKESEEVDINKELIDILREGDTFTANFPCGEFDVEVKGIDVTILSTDYYKERRGIYAYKGEVGSEPSVKIFVEDGNYEVIGKTSDYEYKLPDNEFEMRGNNDFFSDSEKLFKDVNLSANEAKINEALLVSGIDNSPIEEGEEFVVNLPCNTYLVEVKDVFEVSLNWQTNITIEAREQAEPGGVKMVIGITIGDPMDQVSKFDKPEINIEIETGDYIYRLEDNHFDRKHKRGVGFNKAMRSVFVWL